MLRLSFEYGLTNRLAVGVGRTNIDKTFDSFVKYKALQQTTGARPMPVSVTLFASTAITTLRFTDPAVERNTARNYRNALGLGFNIETGGHVFQLHFTNARGMTEKFFVPQTDGNIFNGDIYFGFTVARNFTIKSQLK